MQLVIAQATREVWGGSNSSFESLIGPVLGILFFLFLAWILVRWVRNCIRMVIFGPLLARKSQREEFRPAGPKADRADIETFLARLPVYPKTSSWSGIAISNGSGVFAHFREPLHHTYPFKSDFDTGTIDRIILNVKYHCLWRIVQLGFEGLGIARTSNGYLIASRPRANWISDWFSDARRIASHYPCAYPGRSYVYFDIWREGRSVTLQAFCVPDTAEGYYCDKSFSLAVQECVTALFDMYCYDLRKAAEASRSGTERSTYGETDDDTASEA